MSKKQNIKSVIAWKDKKGLIHLEQDCFPDLKVLTNKIQLRSSHLKELGMKLIKAEVYAF